MQRVEPTPPDSSEGETPAFHAVLLFVFALIYCPAVVAIAIIPVEVHRAHSASCPVFRVCVVGFSAAPGTQIARFKAVNEEDRFAHPEFETDAFGDLVGFDGDRVAGSRVAVVIVGRAEAFDVFPDLVNPTLIVVSGAIILAG